MRFGLWRGLTQSRGDAENLWGLGCGVDSRRAAEQQSFGSLGLEFLLVIDAEFGAGDEGPAKLLDGGMVFGFYERKGTLFFFLVGFAGENVLEGLADEGLTIFDFLEFIEKGGIGNQSFEEFPVGEEHGLLDRGGEVFLEEIGEDPGEFGAEGVIVCGIVSEGNSEGAGEGFGGEGFVEGAGEEEVLRGI
mgnify:CR=1 FL=1